MSTEYDAPRTAKDMIEWTRKKTSIILKLL